MALAQLKFEVPQVVENETMEKKAERLLEALFNGLMESNLLKSGFTLDEFRGIIIMKLGTVADLSKMAYVELNSKLAFALADMLEVGPFDYRITEATNFFADSFGPLDVDETPKDQDATV